MERLHRKSKERPLDKFQSSSYNKITGLHFSESQRLTFFRESTVDIFQFVDYSKRVLKEIDFFVLGFLFSCDVFFLACKPVSFLSIFWAVSLRYTIKSVNIFFVPYFENEPFYQFNFATRKEKGAEALFFFTL